MKLIASTFTLVFLIGLGTSCQKNTDCKLIVTTVDSVGNMLPGTIVKLYATVKSYSSSTTYTADLKAEGVSDGSGASKYTFKLPAILDIKASLGSKTGVGIVKLEEGKTIEKKITVK